MGPDGPGTPESVPRPGVTIVRDAFNVPHVTATTYNGGIWAAGWIAAKDRGLLLQQARYNARVAAIDAPGLSALGLISSLQNFQPSARTEAEVAKQTQVLQNAGPEGQAVLRDIDTFIDGINDYLDMNSPSTPTGRGTTSTPSTPSRGSSSARVAATRPAARSSSPACSSGWGSTGARPSSTTCASSRTPRARPPSTGPSTTDRSPAFRRAA